MSSIVSHWWNRNLIVECVVPNVECFQRTGFIPWDTQPSLNPACVSSQLVAREAKGCVSALSCHVNVVLCFNKNVQRVFMWCSSELNAQIKSLHQFARVVKHLSKKDSECTKSSTVNSTYAQENPTENTTSWVTSPQQQNGHHDVSHWSVDFHYSGHYIHYSSLTADSRNDLFWSLLQFKSI